jgi:hypothetical protein
MNSKDDVRELLRGALDEHASHPDACTATVEWLVPIVEKARQQAVQERDEARAWVRRLTSETRVLTCAFCGQAYPPGTWC